MWERLTGRRILEDTDTLLDRSIAGIQISSPRVCVDCVGDLVVAGLVEASQIVPHFRNIRVESDGTRVSVESISILVDLEVKHAD